MKGGYRGGNIAGQSAGQIVEQAALAYGALEASAHGYGVELDQREAWWRGCGAPPSMCRYPALYAGSSLSSAIARMDALQAMDVRTCFTSVSIGAVTVGCSAAYEYAAGLIRRKAEWHKQWRSKPGSRRIIWTSVVREQVREPHWLDGHFHDALVYGGVMTGRIGSGKQYYTATMVKTMQDQANSRFLRMVGAMHKMLEPMMKRLRQHVLVHDEFGFVWPYRAGPALNFKFRERTGHANLPQTAKLRGLQKRWGHASQDHGRDERDQKQQVERARPGSGSGRGHQGRGLRRRPVVRLYRAAHHGRR